MPHGNIAAADTLPGRIYASPTPVGEGFIPPGQLAAAGTSTGGINASPTVCP